MRIGAFLVLGVALQVLQACSSAYALDYSYGVQLGTTGYSSWNDDLQTTATQSRSRFPRPHSGITFGILGRINIFGTYLALQPEALYATLSVDRGHLGYIDLPLILASSFPGGWPLRPRVYGGPHYAILVHSPTKDVEQLANRTGIMVGLGIEHDLKTVTVAFDLRVAWTDRRNVNNQSKSHYRTIYFLTSLRSR